MKITPNFIVSFETNVQAITVDAWQRRSKSLIWDKFMDVRSSATGRELFTWLVESAKIVKEGQGGNKRFDDLASASFEIVNENSGAGLRLTRNEIEDNQKQIGQGRVMPVLDFAANWARQMGGHAAYWPQQLMFELLAAGESTHGYDGVPFFSASHPVNPALEVSTTYSNLITSKPIGTSVTLDVAASNFNDVCTSIGGVLQPNGKPRGLVPKYVLCGLDLRKRVAEIFGSKTLVASGGAAGAGAAAIDNVIASTYGIEPVVVPELTTAGEYYVACELMPGEGGPLIFQDRSPYVLTSYQPETQSELQRKKEFEWSFDGRNAGAYGHPYLLYKVKPGA